MTVRELVLGHDGTCEVGIYGSDGTEFFFGYSTEFEDDDELWKDTEVKSWEISNVADSSLIINIDARLFTNQDKAEILRAIYAVDDARKLYDKAEETIANIVHELHVNENVENGIVAELWNLLCGDSEPKELYDLIVWNIENRKEEDN